MKIVTSMFFYLFCKYKKYHLIKGCISWANVRCHFVLPMHISFTLCLFHFFSVLQETVVPAHICECRARSHRRFLIHLAFNNFVLPPRCNIQNFQFPLCSIKINNQFLVEWFVCMCVFHGELTCISVYIVLLLLRAGFSMLLFCMNWYSRVCRIFARL